MAFDRPFLSLLSLIRLLMSSLVDLLVIPSTAGPFGDPLSPPPGLILFLLLFKGVPT